jgi:peptidoglycan/xylan/chitin deacetylase (PgdA/CDA1 family)
MGNRKNVWLIGGFLFILTVGTVFTIYSMQHYLRAKAATHESLNQPNYQNSQIGESEPLILNIKDLTLKNEKIKMEQEKAIKASLQDNISKQNSATVQKPAQPGTKPASQPVTSFQKQVQPANKRTVYLTFDDGPEVFTKDIIALLEKYHFKATFFMLDPNMKSHSDVVKLMVQKGESMGLHGVTHNKNLFYASESSVLGEMNQARSTLKSISGVDTVLIRTPYGSAPYMTPEYKKAVAEHGYILWDWNIDSRDWFYKDERYVDSVIDQVAKRGNGNGPIVILLHERRETLVYLPKLFDYLSKQNFDCKAINSLVSPIHF